ncbi:chemotaxis protein CheW [Halotalea alkalilenta]|uniref:chemotaxis protein CheW n=1 Tax=Halotalea alkalilenta TaxID=376489 RepID=UPI0006935D79|nr:chemotaxis protein CheW [Halotalea alkalilenta]
MPFQRYATFSSMVGASAPTSAGQGGWLLFDVEGACFALDIGCLLEIAASVRIHTLPGRRSPCLLGVSNLRGKLVPCFSLALLFNVHPSRSAPSGGGSCQRALIVAADGGPLVMMVDEVAGIFDLTEGVDGMLGAVGGGMTRYVRSVRRWRDLDVFLLDHQRLLAELLERLR